MISAVEPSVADTLGGPSVEVARTAGAGWVRDLNLLVRPRIAVMVLATVVAAAWLTEGAAGDPLLMAGLLVGTAAGYAGVPFDPARLQLRLNGTLLFRGGAPVEFDGDAVSASIRDHRETLIELDLEEGAESIRFYSSDLTADYVHLNADYHT